MRIRLTIPLPPLPAITINDEENDDWMKAMPGHKMDQRLTEQNAAKMAKTPRKARINPNKSM